MVTEPIFPFLSRTNAARSWFNKLRQKFLDYNGAEWKSERFEALQKEIESTISERSEGLDEAAQKLIK
ncbi:hypothetical protein FACS1894200_05690 [Spirochaetia bacterium]|nr:hypothetical protein FACS1894200_05690 [Spirochaetia bacterium]